jgi:tetratricopeptide (TPR) repeat protein
MTLRQAVRSGADLALLFEKAHAGHSSGALAQAERRYKAILDRDPQHFDALHLLGFLNYQLGRPAQALRYLASALKQDGHSPDLLSNYGLVLHALARNEEAISAYDSALALDPDNPDILNRLGVACLHLGRAEAALAAFDRVLSRDPAHIEAIGNRGNALLKLNRLDDAVASYDAALQAGGVSARLLTNRAHVLRRLDRVDEAVTDLRKARSLEPVFAEAAFELGLAQLALGDYENGWAHYERRWETGAFIGQRRSFKSPLWTGAQSPKDRTILLHAEQGFGDTIQFVRYAPLLAQRGARVVLEVQPELHRLLAQLSGVDRVVARGDKLPPFDLHCPLMSLPHAFKTTVASIPAQTPYLSIAHPERAKWAGVLPAGKPLVGICWAGEKSHRNDVNRSVPLASFAELWNGVDAHIVGLQYRPDDEARAFLRACGNVTETSERLEDFVDTAALISCLDVVVTVDTAVAHLAGALSVPTIVMLPRSADFRWLRMRDDSPWYPTVKLFRQPAHKDWDAVVAAVRQHLLNNFCARSTAEASCAGL